MRKALVLPPDINKLCFKLYSEKKTDLYVASVHLREMFRVGKLIFNKVWTDRGIAGVINKLVSSMCDGLVLMTKP